MTSGGSREYYNIYSGDMIADAMDEQEYCELLDEILDKLRCNAAYKDGITVSRSSIINILCMFTQNNDLRIILQNLICNMERRCERCGNVLSDENRPPLCSEECEAEETRLAKGWK